MKDRKITLAVPFILIFTVLYLIFAAAPLEKEYQYEPEWNINITSPVHAESEGERYYFKLGKFLGYFDADGHIIQYVSFPEKASISPEYYAIYPNDAENTVFYNKAGEEVGVISESGFPMFVENQIFVFLPGGNSFSKCSLNGEREWFYEGIIPITAFSAKENFSAVGFADGTVKVFQNSTGKIILDFMPGGSDYAVILGLDISDDGAYIASVSGQDTQRFVLSKKENTQVKIIAHDFLPKGLHSQTIVHFAKNRNTVLYNYNGGIGIVDLATTKTQKIKIDTRIISVEEGNSMIYLLGKSGDTYSVYIIKKNNTLGGTFSFQAKTAFIRGSEDVLFVGRDSSISKISISQK